MDRFEKIKELGRGATGTVFKAFDNETAALVALKIPDPPPSGIDVVTHYRREVDLLGGLKHDGIVRIVAFSLDSNDPWIAYELIKGNTLRELFSSSKQFDADESIRITLLVAQALRYLHDKAIIHRDVNPNNIMITTDGVVKLMDFGIAHRIGEPFPRQLAGTPGYMSPETAKGDEGGNESDIYSLGLVLYEMLSGIPAYSGESVPDVIAKVLSNDFIPLGQRKSGLNEEIYRIVSRMLAGDPQDRYATASELVKDLGKLITGKDEKTGTPSDTPTEEIPSAGLDGYPKLVGIAGPYKGYEFEVGSTITTIGGMYSDIDLSLDPNVAPQHCWILPESGVYWLYDAEDSGGTHLGGRPIKKARLASGDRLTIGASIFRWDNLAEIPGAFRNDDEIEYAPVPAARSVQTRGTTPPQVLHPTRRPQTVSITSIIIAVAAFIVVIGIMAFLNDYYLVPKNETKSILLKLEDSWSSINKVMNYPDGNSIMNEVSSLESDLKYDDLLNMELRSSVILDLPGPEKSRDQNKIRINLVVKTCDLINFLKSDKTTTEKIEITDQTRDYLEKQKLPDADEWEKRRLFLISKCIMIKQKLQEDLVSAQATTSAAGSSKSEVDRFLEGYYLVNESSGALSVDLAREAFNIFQDSASQAEKALVKSATDNTAKVMLILSDYYMIKLRVDHLPLQNWTPDIMDDSTEVLVKGRDALDAMNSQEYETNVPEQVTDSSLRIKGRIKAKYINLIDQYEKITGINIEQD
jgi:hypothetical protein